MIFFCDIFYVLSIILIIHFENAPTTNGLQNDIVFEVEKLRKEPFCDFLDTKQELDCMCYPGESLEHHQFNISSNLLESALKKVGSTHHVVSVRVHSCHALNISINISKWKPPLYRIRIDDVAIVNLNNVKLDKGDALDIWMRRISDKATMSGNIDCNTCNSSLSVADLNFQLKDVTIISLIHLSVGIHTNLIMNISHANSLKIKYSNFKTLSQQALDIYNVSDVGIDHSGFQNCSPGAIMLRLVSNVSVLNSIIDRKSLSVMNSQLKLANNSNSIVDWRCNLSPPSTTLSPANISSTTWDGFCDQSYLFSSLLWNGREIALENAGINADGIEIKGAIVLAVVSSFFLLTAVSILFLLQRSGHLEQYL